MREGSSVHDAFRQSNRPTSKHSHYFEIYDELFSPFRNRNITFVEVGISGGGSLEAWRRYLGDGARIIGIDLNPALRDELEKDGFEVFVGDQADPAFWEHFFSVVGDVDILLDDGGHTNKQTWTTVTGSLRHIRDGGLIIIEDTHTSFMRTFGNPSRKSVIGRLTGWVDELHYRSPEISSHDRLFRSGRRDPDVSSADIQALVRAITFYESMVALKIDRRISSPSVRMNYGSSSALPGGQHPSDFRNRGIRESIRTRLKARLMRVLGRVLSS